MNKTASQAIEQMSTTFQKVAGRHPLLLLLLGGAVLLTVAWGRCDLNGADEPRVAGIANGMACSGDWVVPRLNGTPFLEEPPLFLWSIAAVFRFVAKTDDTARLISGLCALGLLSMTWWLAKGLGLSDRGALSAGFILLTSVAFFRFGWKCTMDMMLAFFTCGAMLVFYRASQEKRSAAALAGWGCLFAAMLAGALMCKSLVGLAIPGVSLLGWLLLCRRKEFRLWVLLALGGLLSLFPVAAWLFMLYQRLGYPAVHTVVWTNNFGRFLGTHPERPHMEAFYHYFGCFPHDFLPWTVFLPLGFVYLYRRFRDHLVDERLSYVLCAFVLPFLLLTASSSKRDVYLLPLYPFAAVLTAMAIESVRLYSDSGSRWFSIPTHMLKWAVFACALIVPPVCIAWKVPVYGCMVPCAVALLLCLMPLEKFARRDVFHTFFYSAAPGVFAILVAINISLSPADSNQSSFRPLFEAIGQIDSHERNRGSVCLFKPKERVSGAAVYYLGHPVASFLQDENLYSFLKAEKANMVICMKKKLRKPDDFNVIKTILVKRDEYVIARIKTLGPTHKRGPKMKVREIGLGINRGIDCPT